MESRAMSIAASSEDWTTSWLEEAQIFSLAGQAARLQSNQTFGGIGKILVEARKPSLTNFRDSYHDFDAHRLEVSNPFIYARRGYKRYDPHSRRYKSWYIPEDWYGSRIDGDDKPHYPRFTEQEGRQILRCSMKSRGFAPLQMGKEWNFQGPKVCDVFNIPKGVSWLSTLEIWWFTRLVLARCSSPWRKYETGTSQIWAC